MSDLQAPAGAGTSVLIASSVESADVGVVALTQEAGGRVLLRIDLADCEYRARHPG